MKLDEYQKEAALTDKKRVLVSACPGSGKTRTVVARYLHMTQELHILPPAIVLLTFTRYASNEMRTRLGESCRRSFIGTFHAFALKIVQQWGHVRGWEPSWLTLLDEPEVKAEERSILADMNLIRVDHKTGKESWTGCKAAEWRTFKERMTSGQYRSDGTRLDRKFCTAWRTFLDHLASENVLTFGTLILEAIEILKVPEAGESLRKQFRHFIADEQQDADQKQWDIINLFEPSTMFVVGDDSQAIYSWRGAQPQLFIDFANSSDVAHYHLPYSYRFDVTIAAPANNLIRHNEDRLDTTIEAIATNQGSVEVVRNARYDEICAIIQREITESGYHPKDIAVLSRTHKILDQLARELEGGSIPFRQVGNKDSIPKSAEMRAIKGYLRLMVNPDDRRAFMAITAAEGLGGPEIREIRQKALLGCVSLLSASSIALPATWPDLKGYLRSKSPGAYDEAIDYVTEFMFYEGIAQVDVQELVLCLMMESVQDQLRGEAKEVTLMTIHAAKGLEFPCVLIVGLNAGVFPSKRSITEGRTEEEVRLCYVAMTRAERKLYLIQTEPTMFEKDLGPSPFFGMMEEE